MQVMKKMTIFKYALNNNYGMAAQFITQIFNE